MDLNAVGKFGLTKRTNEERWKFSDHHYLIYANLDFAFFVCVRATNEKCKNYKFGVRPNT